MEVRAISARRSARRASSSSRRGVNRRCSSATKARAASVEDLFLPGQGLGVDDGQRGRRWCGHELVTSFSGRMPGGRRCVADGTRCRRRRDAVAGAVMRDRGASEQWILVSSWWKFNGLLMSRFSRVDGARPVAAAGATAVLTPGRGQIGRGVDVVRARRRPPHSTSVISSLVRLQIARAPRGRRSRSPRSSAQWSAPKSTGWPALAAVRGRHERRRGERYAARTRATAAAPIPGWSTSETSAASRARAGERGEARPAARSPCPPPSSGLSTSTQPGSSARSRTSVGRRAQHHVHRAQPPSRSDPHRVLDQRPAPVRSSALGRPPRRRPPPAASSSPATGRASGPPWLRPWPLHTASRRLGSGGRHRAARVRSRRRDSRTDRMRAFGAARVAHCCATMASDFAPADRAPGWRRLRRSHAWPAGSDASVGESCVAELWGRARQWRGSGGSEGGGAARCRVPAAPRTGRPSGGVPGPGDRGGRTGRAGRDGRGGARDPPAAPLPAADRRRDRLGERAGRAR